MMHLGNGDMENTLCSHCWIWSAYEAVDVCFFSAIVSQSVKAQMHSAMNQRPIMSETRLRVHVYYMQYQKV